MKIQVLTCAVSAALLAGCSGGGNSAGGSNATPIVAKSVQRVTGTLNIGVPAIDKAAIRTRRAYVSAATGHAFLFIGGNLAGSSTCSSAASTGTCTINWAADIAVPDSYTFDVETDTGPQNSSSTLPAYTILDEGQASYALTAGSNTLSTLFLNGVAAEVSYSVPVCETGSACSVDATIADIAGDAIEYSGSDSSSESQTPNTTGSVFDNGPIMFSSSNDPYTNNPTATNLGGGCVNADNYNDCNDGATDGGPTTLSYFPLVAGCFTSGNELSTTATTFGVNVNVGAAAQYVTVAELNILPTVVFPSPALKVVGTAPSFSCTNGSIASATDSLQIQ